MRVACCSAVLLATACATSAPATRPPQEVGAARLFQATSAAGSEGGYESGRVTRAGIPGPFVLTYLAPGGELEIVAAGAGAQIGRVGAPLAQPFHLAAGMRLAAPEGAPEVVYAGYRPMPMTRPLEAYIGRQILVAAPGAQPEPWWLREVGSDHLTIERSRTYRVIPLRRVGEITWTELTGIDPTPRVTLGPE